MSFNDEALGCAQGDTFTFAIDMQPNSDGSLPDLTGASAEWALEDGNYKGARVWLTKSGAIQRADSGVWFITVTLTHDDTLSVRAGVRHHICKVTLADGSVSHPASGPFKIDRAANP